MSTLNRRCFAVLLAAPAFRSLAQPAMSANPFKLIVPFGAGSAPDTIARLLGEQIGPSWGAPS